MDLLFIDPTDRSHRSVFPTWHVYPHLLAELNRHADRVYHWILLHDTEGDRDEGETVRTGMDARSQSRATVPDLRTGGGSSASPGRRHPSFSGHGPPSGYGRVSVCVPRS